MKRLVSLVAALALSVGLAGLTGCSDDSTSAEAPPDFNVVAGDTQVTVTFTPQPGTEYWIFWGPGSTISATNWTATGGTVIVNASSPRVIPGLTNGTQYAFTINARKNGGPGGEAAPVKTATPRLSGTSWTPGPALGTGLLKGVTSGLVQAGTSINYVGTGGALFAKINDAAATAATHPAGAVDLNAVRYDSVGLVAVGNAGTVLYSTDATTWAAQTSNTTANLNTVTSLSTGGFVAAGAGGALISSSDGKLWTAQTTGTTNNLFGAAFGAAKYVVVGAGGTILTSETGTTWVAQTSGTTQDLFGVVFASVPVNSTTNTNVFIAVGANGTLLKSADAVTWESLPPLALNTRFNAVTWGGQFVAVGANGSIFTSSNGTNWTQQTSGTTQELTAVSRTSTGYVVVGANGTNLYSQ